jgi:hypothetical protein
MEPFEHRSHGRNARTAAVLAAIYAALAALWVWLDMAWFIIAMVALATLPAIWDLWSDRASGLRLDDQSLSWFSGAARAELPLGEIDHMRFDTRLDFSVRVSAVLPGGRRIRLPYDALPPHRSLEAALQARGVRVDRHHFSLL